MTGFQAAREAVAQFARGMFPQDFGTFYVATWGREDATHYQVPAGAREALVDQDPDYVLMDWPTFWVDKTTGQVQALPYLVVMDRLGTMAEVGDRP